MAFEAGRRLGLPVALLAVALLLHGAPVQAQPSYGEAKEVYGDLSKAAGELEDAKKDCVKAGKGAASGVLAWKKSRDLGINKDGWWKKSSLNSLQKVEMEALYKTSYLKFQKAVLAGGKQCYDDPRFKKALEEVKGGDKD